MKVEPKRVSTAVRPNGGGNSPLCGIGPQFLDNWSPLSPEINARPLNRSGKFSQKHRRPTTERPRGSSENAKGCN